MEPYELMPYSVAPSAAPNEGLFDVREGERVVGRYAQGLAYVLAVVLARERRYWGKVTDHDDPPAIEPASGA